MEARFIMFALLAIAACGSTSTPPGVTGTVDAGSLPAIETPPLACTSKALSCACTPADGGAVAPSASLCDPTVAPDAGCCAGPDFPFAGDCLCSVNACADGGAPVPSCSAPPAEIAPAPCNPDECKGMSCGGGECCVSSCQAGGCVATCN